MQKLLLTAIFLLLPNVSWSYPEFIGYKYSSCLTCHYNGQGNGPINDYGRALWATEISGRWFSRGRTTEQLGENSGFPTFGKPLPWWIRPGVKFRQMRIQPLPSDKGEAMDITMQADVNAAFFLDEDQKKTFVVSFGYIPVPQRLKGQPKADDTDKWISREHYFRWQTKDDLWTYVGMMDKVYGIRIANHSAYSRSKTGLNQNDQTHGIVLQYIQPNWELTGHAFIGNLFQEADLRQAGGSAMLEYGPTEAIRFGVSGLGSSNKFIGTQRMAVHLRYGMGYGNAFLFETGVLTDKPKTGEQKQGYYLFSEVMQRLTRGYHAFISHQLWKDEMARGHVDSYKSSLGFLMFPMQRLEFRLEVENGRKLSDDFEVSKESWTALGQVHISL